MPPIQKHKHISIRGDKQIVTEDYALIRKTDRAGSDGKNIKCPHCGCTQRIYHLSWSRCVCKHCGLTSPKYKGWMIDQLDTWKTPR